MALSAAGSSPGRALPAAAPTIVAAEYFTYLPGDDDVPIELHVEQGGTLLFANTDYVGGWHSIASHDEEGRLLFESDWIGQAETSEVRGVSTLAPGAYRFSCSSHEFMQGTLVVDPA